MSWFQVKGGNLRFRGQITRKPFDDWIGSPEGAAAVAAAAHRIRFSLLGRTRAARRRLQRELQSAVATDSMRSTLASEPDQYLAAWTALAYAPSLPRLHVALHRLVVIPRAMVLARTLPALTARLGSCPALAGLDESFRIFFFDRVLAEMEDAIARARPSTRDPILTGQPWVCVDHERTFMWSDSLLSGKEWLGHVMLFEMPARGLQRRERRELNDAVERLKTSLPSMTRQQRSGLVHLATAELRVG